MSDELNTSLNELLTTNFGLSPSGYTGSRGFMGYAGSQGPAGADGTGGGGGGYTGSVGYSGSQGTAGFTGSIGSAGSAGSAGFTGSIGNTGFTGSTGPAGVGYTGSAGTGGGGGSSIYSRTAITATAAQTTFAVAYNPGFLEVYFNGVLLNAVDYTASTGSTVVLTDAAAAGDIVEFIAYSTVSVLEVPTATFNSTNLTANLAITAGYSAVSVGPLSVANGVSITIAAGQKWVIL